MFFSRRKKYQHPGDESRKYQSRTLSHVVRKIKGSEEKARAAKEEADDQGVDPLAEEEEEAAAAAAAAEEEEDWRSAVLEYDDADRHEGPRFTRGGAAHADTNRLNDAAPLGAKEEANALATFTSGRVKEAAEMGLPMASAFLQISFKSIFLCVLLASGRSEMLLPSCFHRFPTIDSHIRYPYTTSLCVYAYTHNSGRVIGAVLLRGGRVRGGPRDEHHLGCQGNL